MKRILLLAAVAILTSVTWAQMTKPLPTLHVEGKWLVDTHENHVVLHGVMDTPSAWFNGGRWGWSYDDAGRQRCLNYFEKMFAGFEKAHCTIFRLHLEPAWTNDPSSNYKYSVAADQPAGISGEADISKFNPTRLKTYLGNLYFPLMQKAMNHGQYVVVRPPGVCPPNLKVGDYYQQYLLEVWDIVSKNSNIKKYAGQIMIELANEPINVRNANNQDDAKALHDYFQPIVDKIRENGFTGIIWVPGTGYQSNYRSYASYPIEGYNIGYAVHDYCGWYNCSDTHCNPTDKIRNFGEAVPVVKTNPVFISEVDWSPEKEPKEFDKLNEHGDSVFKNMGTWATGSTSKWGKAFKATLDYYGNISMTLTHPHDFLEIDTLIEKGKVIAAFGGHPEACAQACMEWYADYYTKDWAHPDFKNLSMSDLGTGKYRNPVIFADFPDPDVIRVDDTYYMVTTTMHHFPGATIVKSKDLVNWEYCAQPLLQLADKDRYNLQNGENAYAAGMWACSMKYHNGKFYLLINGNDTGGWLLTTSNPEGTWEKKKLSRIYYDPGMLFDNGKVYVACGIGNIQMCELDENFNFKQEKNVISNKDGLEGCHLYKIGEYYYIYATYGGWPSGQAIFRSKNIFGPYEEKMLVEKIINDKPNTVHQGALFDTPTGEWWTIMQEDLGCFGRMPNLQPVKWEEDWPIVGNKGVPYATHNKPDVGTIVQRAAMPTNDNFRTYPLGMQWEWNHNPDDAAWSLFERPGWLRLRASGSATRLTQARNMLTQRIFAFHGKSNQASIGTVRLDVSHLAEGDRAGICVFQDPYAAIAVEVKNGQKQLVWWQDTLRVRSNFQPTEQTQAIDIDSVIYLRASQTYGTSKTKFYYSLDNETYTELGGETEQSFSLTVFVGSRFGIFCYAQDPDKTESSYADFDWFSTEEDYEETKYYPATFEGYNADMLTATQLTVGAEDMEIMVGGGTPLQLTATFADGHKKDVSAQAKYTSNAGDDIIAVQSGQIRGLREGTATVTASYTDPMGNELTASFNVRSTFFPFASQFINTSLFSNGTYNESTHEFKPGQYGQMGWVYSNGADMSAYKYLVIKLKRQQTCSGDVRIYTDNSIWGNCHQTTGFGSSRRKIIKLQEAKYTSGDKKGQPLELDNIRIIAFWGNGGGTIVVDDMYLTNNDDYSPSGVEEIHNSQFTIHNEAGAVYDLSGRKIMVNGHVLLSEGEKWSMVNGNLPKGVYIVNGRKVVKK